MTKEEAIKILTGYMGGKIDPESTELYHAIELVVDILESQPPLPSDSDEAAKEFAKTTFKKPYSDNPDEEVTIVEPDKYAGFIAGAEWDREQMMREAVEYEVVDFSSSLDTNPHINVPLDNKKYRSGDKVCIIIVEEKFNEGK